MIYNDKVGDKMTKQVKILASIGFLFIVAGLITNFTTSFTQDKEEVSRRMNVVNSSYETFKQEAKDFSTTRDNIYNNVFSNLYFETLNLSINNCLEELQKYEQKLDEMEKTVQELKENCNGIYFPESQTNNKCQTYATSYEEMVNYFINDITQVNQNIEEYNKYNQENATGIPPISKYSTTKDYIDFNGDKEYAGKEDF